LAERRFGWAAAIAAQLKISLIQQHQPALDLVELKANKRLAVRTIDRRRAADGEPQVRIIPLIASFLESDETRASRVAAPNGQIPFGQRAKVVRDSRRFDGRSPIWLPVAVT
jgi:hypothetical protein